MKPSAAWVRALLAAGPTVPTQASLTPQAVLALSRAYGCAPDQADACLAAVDEVWRVILLQLAARAVGLAESAPLREPATWSDCGLPGFLDGTDTTPEPPPGWNELIADVRTAVAELPASPWAGDTLAELHHALYPRAVRHATGAYYTPDWLARRVVASLTSRPASVIDPSCGSGSFLLAAIDVLWPSDEPSQWLPRLAGIDNDPLAVLAAKASLLLRIGSPRPAELRLPIARADAVLDEPPFAQPFDAVIGNPPWVFWNHLAPDYRAALRGAMERYGLIAVGRSTMGQLGAACKDLSMLFVHASAARYLADGGQLAFIVPQTMLQSTAGHEFRRLTLPDGTPLGCLGVEDWSGTAPFVGAANRPMVLRLIKGQPTRWPVPYDHVVGNAAGRDVRLEPGWARPSDPADPASFWQIDRQEDSIVATSSDNATRWPGRVGIDTKLEGLFRLQVTGQNLFAITARNVTRNIKQPMPELEVELEPDLLYPIVAGGSLLDRWGAAPDCCYLVPHTPETGQQPLPIEVMAEHYPLTLAYLTRFQDRLEQRSIHQRWGAGQPWYAVYNIGPYSFAPWRVVWKASGTRFGASVISEFEHPILGRRPLLAAKSVILLPFDQPAPAYFVCGLLNSSHSRERIASGVRGWVHQKALNLVPAIPSFDESEPRHLRIAELAEQAHALTAAGDSCAAVERELDALAMALWGLADG